MEDETEPADWWNSPHTKKFIDQTRTEAAKSALELEQACRQTTDPKVAAAFAKWKTQQALADNMAKRAPRAS